MTAFSSSALRLNARQQSQQNCHPERSEGPFLPREQSHAPARGVSMDFRSDNVVGAHSKIIEAVTRAFAAGPASSYGEDDWTQRVEQRLRHLFDKADLLAFPVATGTAANALALSCCTPPWGVIYCHPSAHIAVDEANAPELFSSGAKLVTVDGPAGKIDVEALARLLAAPVYGVVHHAP